MEELYLLIQSANFIKWKFFLPSAFSLRTFFSMETISLAACFQGASSEIFNFMVCILTGKIGRNNYVRGTGMHLK